MPALLVVALIVVPLLEIYVLTRVGALLGLVPTLVLLLVVSLLGAALLRKEGRRTWRALQGALATGKLPTREIADGGLVVFGGALLLTPGFLTDIVGLACVLPGSRAVMRRLLLRVLMTRLTGGLLGGRAGAVPPWQTPGARGTAGGQPGARGSGGRGSTVVEGTVVDGTASDPDKRDGPLP